MKNKNGKKIFENFSHVEGWLYDASNLSFKETGPNSKNPGTKYIGGSIDIATDDNCTNIVTVNFTYELPIKPYKSKDTGADIKNDNWDILSDIINGVHKTVLSAGKDSAATITIDGNVDVNEYYTDKTSPAKLVSFKQNRGGFIHVGQALRKDEAKRSTFMTDILIHGVTVYEPDADKELDLRATVEGYIFGYGPKLLPVSFDVTHPDAISYFEGLNASNKNPILTKVSGVQVNQIVKKKVEVASAWGTDIKEVENTNRSWKITWAQTEPYEFDTPETLTVAELNEALAARKTREAELKAQFDNRGAKPSAIPTGGFDF